ncbi:MAG: MBL fold metallo-hydrolase [Pseudomonadota bacterium]
MRVASLGSGSKGNATLVAASGTLLLVDCGFSAREAERRCRRLGVNPADIDAILVTHEHSDHSGGVATLSRRFGLPVYLTYGTASSGRCEGCHSTHLFNAGERFTVGDIDVSSVPVPHDAREPCQYRLTAAGCDLGILTDLGSITPHVVESYRDCAALLLEFNHDLEMLRQGDYPPALKQRVGGDWGHLNNGQAAQLLAALHWPGLRDVVVAHISENNNCRMKAESAIGAVLDDLSLVTWADQADGFGWLDLAR